MNRTIGPYVLGRKPRVLLTSSLVFTTYHFLLGSLGSGRVGPDHTLPEEVRSHASALTFLRAPGVPVHNQWMYWEATLLEEQWDSAFRTAVSHYGESVVSTLSPTLEWAERALWPRWAPLLETAMQLVTAPSVSEGLAAQVPALLRIFEGELTDEVVVAVVPRRAIRPPVAFNHPHTISLHMAEPEVDVVAEALLHRLAHASVITPYLEKRPNLIQRLDAALKAVNVYDDTIDTWHTIAHFGAADLARRALGAPRMEVPGHRDLASTRRVFLDERARIAWRDLVDQRCSADHFVQVIADVLVRTRTSR